MWKGRALNMHSLYTMPQRTIHGNMNVAVSLVIITTFIRVQKAVEVCRTQRHVVPHPYCLKAGEPWLCCSFLAKKLTN